MTTDNVDHDEWHRKRMAATAPRPALLQLPNEQAGWDVVIEFRIEDDIAEADVRRQIQEAVIDGFMVGHVDIEIAPHMVAVFGEGT